MKIPDAGVLLALAVLFTVAVPAADTQKPVLWLDPGKVEELDFTFGVGGKDGVPTPPFRFVREDAGGTSAKIRVTDARGLTWRMKGGKEARAEVIATRLAWACGYFVENLHFVAKGRIQGIGKLKRASGFVQPDGSFTYAGFELVDKQLKFSPQKRWTWKNNHFSGTQELNGLKVLVMLLSNWDNKDARDQYRGSNTGVAEATWGGQRRLVYFVNDWGKSLGGWGRRFGRTEWDCQSFRDQTPQFIQGSSQDVIEFGFGGQHTGDFTANIRQKDLRWLLQYLGRVTDAQIRMALRVSGATPEEEECFAGELRRRIDRLKQAAGNR